MFRKQCEATNRKRLVYVELFKMIHCYLIDRQVVMASKYDGILKKVIIPRQNKIFDDETLQLNVEMCNIIILDNRYLTTISARLQLHRSDQLLFAEECEVPSEKPLTFRKSLNKLYRVHLMTGTSKHRQGVLGALRTQKSAPRT